MIKPLKKNVVYCDACGKGGDMYYLENEKYTKHRVDLCEGCRCLFFGFLKVDCVHNYDTMTISFESE